MASFRTSSRRGLTGREVRVRRYPAGGVSADDFEVVEVRVPDPGPGQVLVRNTWTSVDPGLRLRLRTNAPAGYFVAFPLGQAMDGIMAVGQVLESRADGFSPGDTVSHALGWRDYAVVDPATAQLGGVGTSPPFFSFLFSSSSFFFFSSFLLSSLSSFLPFTLSSSSFSSLIFPTLLLSFSLLLLLPLLPPPPYPPPFSSLPSLSSHPPPPPPPPPPPSSPALTPARRDRGRPAVAPRAAGRDGSHGVRRAARRRRLAGR